MPSFNNQASKLIFSPADKNNNNSNNNESNNNNNNNNTITTTTTTNNHPHHHNSINENYNRNDRMLPSNKTIIDEDFVINTFATMDGLLAQYEAILTYERNQLLTKQRNSRPPPSGFLTTNSRFWEFKIENDTTTYVRYGIVQEDGSLKERATQIQNHMNAQDAKLFVERLIDEKLKAGFTGWTQW